MVSSQKGPTRHAYAWQIGPFWQDTLEFPMHLLIERVPASGSSKQAIQSTVQSPPPVGLK